MIDPKEGAQEEAAENQTEEQSEETTGTGDEVAQEEDGEGGE